MLLSPSDSVVTAISVCLDVFNVEAFERLFVCDVDICHCEFSRAAPLKIPYSFPRNR